MNTLLYVSHRYLYLELHHSRHLHLRVLPVPWISKCRHGNPVTQLRVEVSDTHILHNTAEVNDEIMRLRKQPSGWHVKDRSNHRLLGF
jgi:hypothetical protein